MFSRRIQFSSRALASHPACTKCLSYLVSICTGNRRGAGTTAAIFMKVIGENASTQLLNLDGNFERNSVVKHRIETPYDLGKIVKIRIGHDNKGDLGVGWYLENVDIRHIDDQTNKEVASYNFRANRWLGESDVGSGSGPASIILRQYNPELRRLLSKYKQRTPLIVHSGAFASPHPDKVQAGERAVVRRFFGKAGEDSYCITPLADNHHDSKSRHNDGSASNVVVAVADGIFSWRKQGIDAGLFSKALVIAASHAAQTHIDDLIIPEPVQKVDDQPNPLPPKISNSLMGDSLPMLPPVMSSSLTTPVDLKASNSNDTPMRPLFLLQAAEAVLRAEGIKGSSTACIVAVEGSIAKLHVANLGDSGLAVIRQNKVVFRTEEQEHSFGHPFQLGHHASSDRAEDSQLYSFSLKPNDVIVVGSDGLFDNVNETEMIEVYKSVVLSYSHQKKNSLPGILARELTSLAFHNSLDKDKSTPYSSAATEAFNMVYSGGKKDDICVVCSLVEADPLE